MNAYYNDSHFKKTSVEDKAANAVCKIISLFTNNIFVTVLKIIAVISAIWGFVATVGKVSDGEMSFIGGVLICAVLSVIEIFVIGSIVQKDE